MSLEKARLMVIDEMNPLDLLAEVAVSCSDDEKTAEKIAHCEAFMEPEADLIDPETSQDKEHTVHEQLQQSTPTEEKEDIKSDQNHGKLSKDEAKISLLRSFETIQWDSEEKHEVPTFREKIFNPEECTEDNITSAQFDGNRQNCVSICESQFDSGIVLVEDDPVISAEEISSKPQTSYSFSSTVADNIINISPSTDSVPNPDAVPNTDSVHTAGRILPIIKRTPADQARLCYSIVGNRIVGTSLLDRTHNETVFTHPVPRALHVNETVSQRVTQLLSPNFKLTMTNNIPIVPKKSKSASLVIGNLGSTTMQAPAVPVSSYSLPSKHRTNTKPATILKMLNNKNRYVSRRKYPNISMSTLPSGYPLLDHDYCYHSFCDIVQAAKKLINGVYNGEINNTTQKADGSAGPKDSNKLTKVLLTDDEGKPLKKKYRTKRIIAAELEAVRRACLKAKADEGDEEAKRELDEIKSQEEEEAKKLSEKTKKKYNKQRRDSSSNSTPASAISEELKHEAMDSDSVTKKSNKQTMDSDDEVINDIEADIDAENPVVDHDPAFQDQFVYFGSKKYKSRRRHLNKKEDPYKKFWTTGELNTPPPPKTEVNTAAGGSADMVLHDSQEINDVFDVLGISACPEGVSDTKAEVESVEESVTSPALNDNQTAAYSSAAVQDKTDQNTSDANHIQQYTQPVNSDSCSNDAVPKGPPVTQTDDKQIIDTDSTEPGSAQMNADSKEASVVEASLAEGSVVKGSMVEGCVVEGSMATSDDGLDDLLQGITMDEMSELITLALDDDQPLTQDSTGRQDSKVAKPSEQAADGSPNVLQLSALARNVCLSNDITLPSSENVNNGQLSQQSQTSNISLDFTEADLLSSDRNINIDLLNSLSATPPKPTHRPSPHGTPSSYINRTPTSKLTESPSTAATESPVPATQSWSEEAFNSPIVVPVTMYWNTFPALLLDGVKYVRLIDISRQCLPSKETGLLKKRAQVLGYDVINCTEMQRNLLVRYAFACQSRSTIMVSEAAAAEVIASYMEKSEIEELSKAPPLPGLQPSVGNTVSASASRAPAEPTTLMPQFLVEHKPLQKSNSRSSKNSTGTVKPLEHNVKERSSRLRQVKTSYRRFLSLGSNNSNTTAQSVAADSIDTQGCVIGDNASDRGYHSDQSPDSVVEKPVTTSAALPAKEGNKRRSSTAGRKPKSARAIIEAPSTQTVAEVAEEPMVRPAVVAQRSSESLDSGVQSLEPVSESVSQETVLTSVDSLTAEQDIDSSETLKTEQAVDTDDIIVYIRHIDLVEKKNGTRSSQNGDVIMKHFKSLHSACIRCCSCRQFFTLKAFTKHQHSGHKLIPVKVRQRVEARDSSVDSEDWQTFKKQKKIYETTRSPLKKLSETKLAKPVEYPKDVPYSDNNNTTTVAKVAVPKADIMAALNTSPKKSELQLLVNKLDVPEVLGKRIPKQKKRNPDELYYTRSSQTVSETGRKRKIESIGESERKRRAPGTGASLRKHSG